MKVAPIHPVLFVQGSDGSEKMELGQKPSSSLETSNSTTASLDHTSAEDRCRLSCIRELEAEEEGVTCDKERVSQKYKEHLGDHRQYWRDIILGINDGLVSTFLLVAGVAGSKLSTTDILLTAIAGAIAGAVSMALGEFLGEYEASSTKPVASLQCDLCWPLFWQLTFIGTH